jgi:acetyl-CoA carboxylase, biotin carboxylase subunit
VRDDSGFYEGATVPSHYDPLVSKLSVWAPDRPAALRRMRRALSEYIVTGIRTNLAFHERLIAHPDFAAGRYHTSFLDQHSAELLGDLPPSLPAGEQELLAAAVAVAAHTEGTHAADRALELPDRLSPWVHQHRARALR